MADFVPTVAYIGHHAAAAPDRVAVIENGRAIPYEKFHRDIGKMAAALQGLGVEAGEKLAVEVTGFYSHWVMLLACEMMGVATLSFNASEIETLGSRFGLMDRVFCSPISAPAQARQIHHFDRGWIASAAADGLGSSPVQGAASATNAEFEAKADAGIAGGFGTRIGLETPLRIVKSYGTTGVLELMVHTARVHDFWLNQFRWRASLDRRSRYLLTAGFAIQVFQVHATACIRMGGTCLCGNPADIVPDIQRYGATHATFMTGPLEALLDKIEPGGANHRLKQVFTVGAPAAKSVRDRACQVLADEVSESYGTNEAGGITTVDETGEGTVFPGVAVETVDPSGKPVLGVAGRVRVRSDGCVQEYLDDPERTARLFQEGWFYPGDIGVMPGPARLKLIGRVEDYLFIWGTRYSLPELENVLRTALPLSDVCLLKTGGEDSTDLILLSVPNDPSASAVIREKVRSFLPDGTGTVDIVDAIRIPRGADGGIQRAKLAWQLEQQRAEAAAAAAGKEPSAQSEL